MFSSRNANLFFARRKWGKQTYWKSLGYKCSFWSAVKERKLARKVNRSDSQAHAETDPSAANSAISLFPFSTRYSLPSLFFFRSQTSSAVAKVSAWGRFKFSAAFRGQFVILTGANQNTGARSSPKIYGPSLRSCRTQIKFWIRRSNPGKYN